MHWKRLHKILSQGVLRVRIGIIGTENSHTDHYIRHFNTEQRFGEHRVTVLAGGDNERNRALAAAGSIEQLVAEPADLVGMVDAAIVCSRDGNKHAAQVLPLLQAGCPAFVDKPLACDVTAARSILTAANDNGVPVTSFSSLRLVPETVEFADRLAAGSPPEVLYVGGPADKTSEYGGMFYYGIHVVELALALAPARPIDSVVVSEVESAVVVSAQVGPTRLMMEFDKPGARTATSWRAHAVGPDGLSVVDIRLTPDYVASGSEAFAAMLDSGEPPLPDSELLAPVELLQTVNAALASVDA
jgi:predicted dehydrogenase